MRILAPLRGPQVDPQGGKCLLLVKVKPIG